MKTLEQYKHQFLFQKKKNKKTTNFSIEISKYEIFYYKNILQFFFLKKQIKFEKSNYLFYTYVYYLYLRINMSNILFISYSIYIILIY